MKENFKYMYYRKKDGSIIMDTGISGADFGNSGFGSNVFENCQKYGKSLIGRHIKYNDKDYLIVEYDVLRGLLGNYGSIFVKLEEI